MQLRKAAKGLSGVLGAWALGALDALPPHKVAEGALEGKETGEDGGPRIVVNGTRISVDAATFRLLRPGERIKVRYTARLRRAISIARYVER